MALFDKSKKILKSAQKLADDTISKDSIDKIKDIGKAASDTGTEAVSKAVKKVGSSLDRRGAGQSATNAAKQNVESRFVSASCPQCGATLELEDGIDTFYCKYCGNRIILTNQSDETVKAKAAKQKLEHREKMADKLLSQMDERAKRKAAEKERQRKNKNATIIGCFIVMLAIAGICFVMADRDKKARAEKAAVESVVQEQVVDTPVSEDYEYDDELTSESSDAPALRKAYAYSVGDIISFGTYPFKSADDNKSISWEVISVDKVNNRIQLRCTMAIDGQPYHDDAQCNASWEDCSLREWLNTVFYINAFSDEERQHIIEAPVEYGDGVLLEKITIPSYRELQVLGEPGLRIKATRYAYVQGVTVFRKDKIDHPVRNQTNTFTYNTEKAGFSGENTYCGYWIRPEDNDSDTICYISGWGYYKEDTYPGFGSIEEGIRPQLWIALD